MSSSKFASPFMAKSPLDQRKSMEAKRREAKRKRDIASGKLKVTRKTKPIGGRQKLAADGETWVDVKETSKAEKGGLRKATSSRS
jgi:hypothetical protein